MAARVTAERVLRDDDDESGQTVREWKIEGEGGSIIIRPRDRDGFLIMRGADIDQFIADLRRARDAAASLDTEMP